MSDVKFIYSCSCNSNLGRISSRIVKEIGKRNIAKVVPLPDPFDDDRKFIRKAKSVKLNITVDGCGVGCAHKALTVRKIDHLNFKLTDYGCEKGKTEVTDELVERLFNEINTKIGEACA
ncbi:MAG TPA: putative zinc-binding protein [Clostridiales bacterium]|nr:putative zinc-binding protein [Clostridiales bacterium]